MRFLAVLCVMWFSHFHYGDLDSYAETVVNLIRLIIIYYAVGFGTLFVLWWYELVELKDVLMVRKPLYAVLLALTASHVYSVRKRHQRAVRRSESLRIGIMTLFAAFCIWISLVMAALTGH